MSMISRHNTQYIVKEIMWKDRTGVLIGEKGLNKLDESHVAVIGIGGVGGYVATMLARAGIGNITLVDFDVVDETNINRQLVANTTTVGLFKTEVMKKQLLEINPNCKITIQNKRINLENMEKILSVDFDFVVDAIDSVQDKVELICFCKEKQIPIISAMGAGNRISIPNFKVCDVYKTSNDGLAKILRKKLRERDIVQLDVVTCDESPIKNSNNIIGSISYFPAMCGCVISAYVIQNLLKNIDN